MTTTKSNLVTISNNAYNAPSTNSNPVTGFKYTVTDNGDDIIIAYAGTDFPMPNDLFSDLQIATNNIPTQYNEALTVYWQVKNNPNNSSKNIILTGHSLGGSLAQLVAASTGATAMTFNSYGVFNLLPQLGLRTDVRYPNITNYNLSSDILNIANYAQGKENIGTSYIIPDNNINPFSAHKDFNKLENSEVAIEAAIWQNQHLAQIQQLKTLYKISHLLFTGFIISQKPVFIALILANYTQATTAPAIIYDPLLVDLNGDGIKTTSVENGVYFDHQKDGFAERSAWVDENDGILVIDKNGDGIINDGGDNDLLVA